MSTKIPATVVTGFLGAGKSTWLRHQLHAGLLPRTAVIVNEAAEFSRESPEPGLEELWTDIYV